MNKTVEEINKMIMEDAPMEEINDAIGKTIERKIGNTWYVIETECDGNEPLADKVKRLIFSDKGVIC